MELRRIEEASIERAIVHVLDKNSDQPLLTDAELELEPAVTAFLTHHILKSLSSEKNRKLKLFNPSGVVYGNLMKIYDDETDNFVEASKEIAQWLFKCMQEHPIIPSADVIVCQFSTGGERCLAVMKMDYQPSFVHDIQYEENGFKVDLVSQEISLPSLSQRLNKAAFSRSLVWMTTTLWWWTNPLKLKMAVSLSISKRPLYRLVLWWIIWTRLGLYVTKWKNGCVAI